MQAVGALEEMDQHELGSQLMRLGRDKRLGKRSLKVLASMADAPQWSAMSSITEIAEANGVSPSTVTRIATRIGFTGFGDLQSLFRRSVTQGGFYSDPARALLPEGGQAGDADALSQVAEAELNNVHASIGAIDPQAMREAARLLASARRTRVLGLRQCYSLAHFAAYGLHLIRDGVGVLGAPGHTLLEDIGDLDGRDVAIVISFKPYTREVISACELMREASARTVLLTDSHEAPFDYDSAFFVATGGPFFFNAMAGAFAVIEALLLETARAIGNDAVERLDGMERLFVRMNVET